MVLCTLLEEARGIVWKIFDHNSCSALVLLSYFHTHKQLCFLTPAQPKTSQAIAGTALHNPHCLSLLMLPASAVFLQLIDELLRLNLAKIEFGSYDSPDW